MLKKTAAVVAFAGLLTWGASAQDAKSVIGAASAAIGVEQLKTVQYSATGFDFALGQSYNPEAPWPKFINKSYTRAIDFQVPASRVERVRLQGENPPRGGGQQPVRGEQSQTQTIIVDANTPWAQQLELWMMPHGFLRAAATKNATLRTQSVNGKRYNVLSFTGDNKAAVNGFINDQNLVERVETWIDSPILGDMPFEAVYSDYKDFAGVKFPTRIVQRQGGHPMFDLTVADVRPNAPVTIQPPQGRGGAPAGAGGGAAGGAQANAAPSEKLADGVYLILGGYASVAVEFKDHIGDRRERSERRAGRGGHRRSEAPGAEQADPLHRQHAPSLRSLQRPAAAGCGRRDGRHASDQQVVLRAGVHRAAHAQPRPAGEIAAQADVRHHDRPQGPDRRQPDPRAAPPARQRAQRRHHRRLPAEGTGSSSRRMPTIRRPIPPRRCRCRPARTPSTCSRTSSGSGSSRRASSPSTIRPTAGVVTKEELLKAAGRSGSTSQ